MWNKNELGYRWKFFYTFIYIYLWSSNMNYSNSSTGCQYTAYDLSITIKAKYTFSSLWLYIIIKYCFNHLFDLSYNFQVIYLCLSDIFGLNRAICTMMDVDTKKTYILCCYYFATCLYLHFYVKQFWPRCGMNSRDDTIIP